MLMLHRTQRLINNIYFFKSQSLTQRLVASHRTLVEKGCPKPAVLKMCSGKLSDGLQSQIINIFKFLSFTF